MKTKQKLYAELSYLERVRESLRKDSMIYQFYEWLAKRREKNQND